MSKITDKKFLDKVPKEGNTKRSFYEATCKRVIDVILSSMGLALLVPVYGAIYFAIKIDDPGPVLFIQKRVGKNKHFFNLHKFRTMKMSTPHDMPTHMLENPEQYITKVGKFLRKFSLDELPQIWDIFVGNMSIIGPRPALWNQDDLIAEREKYDANSVTPGLTGWAQINGRDELEITVKAKLDGDYIKKLRSDSLTGFLFDIKCFFGTIVSVVKSDGVVEGGTGEIKKRENISSEEPIVLNITSEKQEKMFSDTDQIHVLVGGKGSYIGTRVRDYLTSDSRFTVTELDMIGDEWKRFDFTPYDVVYQVAGIVHQKVTGDSVDLYYKVNCDLAVDVAKKAKAAGVKQFVYMSSMSVYGLETSNTPITLSTSANPATNYGFSKLQAEEKLRELVDANFVVSCLRPPMVYGEGAPGNLDKLFKAVRKFRMFPTVKNERSSISVLNLAVGVKEVIEKGYTGVVILQDSRYRCTTEIIGAEMKKEGVKIIYLPFFNPVVKMLIGKVGLVSKVFGDLKYEMCCDSISEKDIHVNHKCPKRVLILGHIAYIIAEFNVPNIKLLRDMGYEVDVACNFESADNVLMSDEVIERFRYTLKDLGCECFQVDFKRNPLRVIENLKAYKQCVILMEKRQYAFMHCHSPVGGAVSRIAAHKCGVPAIYTAHGFHFYTGAPKKNWMVFYPVEKALSKWTDVLVTITKEDYKRAKDNFYAKKTVYLPGVGVDTDRFSEEWSPENRTLIRCSEGVPEGKLWMLSVGELNDNKNHKTVIEALSKISSNKIFYTVVGTGAKKGYLENLIKKLGLEEDVKLLGFRDDVANLYRSADIYIHPSHREGLSVAIIEAMASGLPCIVGMIRGNVDLIDEGKGGVFFNPASIDDCSLAITRFEELSQDKRICMGNYNRKKAVQYDKDTLMKKTKKIYELMK